MANTEKYINLIEYLLIDYISKTVGKICLGTFSAFAIYIRTLYTTNIILAAVLQTIFKYLLSVIV